MKMIITMLILGAPVALVMAWAYELTPGGLRREADIEPGQSSAQANASKLDRTITIALILAVAYFSYDKFVLGPRRDADLLESAGVQDQLAPEPGETAQEIIRSIAVLPFVNMSEDAGNEYFADGLSEELLNMLVKIPDLRVAARTSSFSFKGKDVTVADIAQELNVSHVLEGSVRKSGDKVRITAQLIKADDGFHLWSENYDRTLKDIFVVQDEIASKVAQALEVELLGKSKAERGIAPEAHIAYLKGLQFLSQSGPANTEKALQPLIQATILDPEYAEAWANLAITYNEMINNGRMTREEAAPLVKSAIERAEDLDPNLALAWGIHGYIQKNLHWDWQAALEYTQKAYELEPNHASIMAWRASTLTTLGKLDDAVALYERAYVINPLGLSIHSALGLAYNKVRRHDDAIKTFERQIELSPNYHWAYYNLGRSYLYKGDAERALLEINKNPENHFKVAGLVMAYSTLGRENEAQTALKRLVTEYGSLDAVIIAGVYAWRGDIDDAFQWLENGFERRAAGIAYILGSNFFESLIDDPRWADFLKKVELLEYWQAMPAEYGGPQP